MCKKVLLVSFTIVFMLFLVSCTGGENKNANGSDRQNSGDTVTNSASSAVDTDDPDVVVSNSTVPIVSSGHGEISNDTSNSSSKPYNPFDGPEIDESLSYIPFPKLPIEQITSAKIKSTFSTGSGPDNHLESVTDEIGKEYAVKLAQYFNGLEPEMTKYTNIYFGKLAGGRDSFKISFTLSDGSTIDLYCNAFSHCKVKANNRYYRLDSGHISDYITFVLGIRYYDTSRVGRGVVPTKYIEPELRSGLAHATKDAEQTEEFPQISEENISSVTVLARANEPNETRILLNKKQTQDLIKKINKPKGFVATEYTAADFSYDYGDYYRIIFDYTDGSQVQISYDGYFHSSLSSTYFWDLNAHLSLFLVDDYSYEGLNLKIYPFK